MLRLLKVVAQNNRYKDFPAMLIWPGTSHCARVYFVSRRISATIFFISKFI